MRSLLTLPIVGCILAGIPLGLGGYTFYYAEGGSYFSNDPKACVNCHIMRDEYDSWQKASHHSAATCNGCHVPHDFLGKYANKAHNGFWHSYYFTFQNFHEPIQISEYNRGILRTNCLECHREFMSRVIGGHNNSDGSSMDCIHCHMHSGHGPPR